MVIKEGKGENKKPPPAAFFGTAGREAAIPICREGRPDSRAYRDPTVPRESRFIGRIGGGTTKRVRAGESAS